MVVGRARVGEGSSEAGILKGEYSSESLQKGDGCKKGIMNHLGARGEYVVIARRTTRRR